MDRFVKIKKKYVSTFPQKKVDLETAWENKEISILHDLLHKLSGSSGSYGFNELCLISQAAIKLTIKYDLKDVDELGGFLDQIFTIFDKEKNN